MASVLEHQTDSATEFGLRTKWRLESMKAFVRQHCSARLARARLRQSGPINMEFKAGDLIMYRKAEGPRWHAPGGIIGFEYKVLWTLHQGTPVAVATGRARPANVSEILAHMVLGDRVLSVQLNSSELQDSSRVSWTFLDVGACVVKWILVIRTKKLEQPLVRARTAPAASSESPQLEQRSLVTGVDVERTTSAEGEGESQQSQKPNQQLHWKTHGCVGTQMEHQILESDLLDF